MRFMLLSTCDRLRRFRKWVAFPCLLLLIFNPLHRAAHRRFQPKATLGYDVDQTAFVMDLLDDPESHPLHVKR